MGRVVMAHDGLDEKSSENPGHVVGFTKHEKSIFVQVQFADGDRRDVSPNYLEPL
jgi:hypothetical protein